MSETPRGSKIGSFGNNLFITCAGGRGNDLLIWQRHEGKAVGALNSDGDHDVDKDDLAKWEAEFGSPAVAVSAAIPEPSTLALVFCTGLAMRGGSAFRKKKRPENAAFSASAF